MATTLTAEQIQEILSSPFAQQLIDAMKEGSGFSVKQLTQQNDQFNANLGYLKRGQRNQYALGKDQVQLGKDQLAAQINQWKAQHDHQMQELERVGVPRVELERQDMLGRQEIARRAQDLSERQFQELALPGLQLQQQRFGLDTELGRGQLAQGQQRIDLESELGRGDLALRGELGRRQQDYTERAGDRSWLLDATKATGGPENYGDYLDLVRGSNDAGFGSLVDALRGSGPITTSSAMQQTPAVRSPISMAQTMGGGSAMGAPAGAGPEAPMSATPAERMGANHPLNGAAMQQQGGAVDAVGLRPQQMSARAFNTLPTAGHQMLGSLLRKRGFDQQDVMERYQRSRIGQ